MRFLDATVKIHEQARLTTEANAENDKTVCIGDR
jgi:hypothetical protein